MEKADGGIQWAANLSALFASLPLTERPRAARNAGFEHVETWWPFEGPSPDDSEVSAFCHAVEVAGTQLVAMNLYGGRSGRRGVLSDPAETDDFRRSVRTSVTVAERLGTRLFNAPYGPALQRVAPAEQRKVASSNLRHAAQALGSVDGTVLLEPLSSPTPSVECFPIDSLERAWDVLTESGAGNAGLLFDQFHLEVNGFDLRAELGRWSREIRHVQIADAPPRSEPGSGRTDYAAFFRALHSIGYRGHVALEFFPSSGSVDPLRHWRQNRAEWERGA